MNYTKKVIAISAFSMLLLALPAVAAAQFGGYGGYGGYGNNSRYNRNIRGTIESLKNKAKSFEKTTNRAEDRYEDRRDDRNDRWGNRNGNWGGYGYPNGQYGQNNRNISRIEDLADNFKKATDDLLDEYGRGRDLRGSENQARRVLDLANQIDNEISRTNNRNLRNQWNQMRRDLSVVADTYGYRGYNGTNNRNTNRFPWPF